MLEAIAPSSVTSSQMAMSKRLSTTCKLTQTTFTKQLIGNLSTSLKDWCLVSKSERLIFLSSEIKSNSCRRKIETWLTSFLVRWSTRRTSLWWSVPGSRWERVSCKRPKSPTSWIECASSSASFSSTIHSNVTRSRLFSRDNSKRRERSMGLTYSWRDSRTVWKPWTLLFRRLTRQSLIELNSRSSHLMSILQSNNPFSTTWRIYSIQHSKA